MNTRAFESLHIQPSSQLFPAASLQVSWFLPLLGFLLKLYPQRGPNLQSHLVLQAGGGQVKVFDSSPDQGGLLSWLGSIILVLLLFHFFAPEERAPMATLLFKIALGV